MKEKIESLIAKLKIKGKGIYATKDAPDPDATINVWYVIAQLEEVLLEEK